MLGWLARWISEGPATIELAAEERDSHLRISVSDHGGGVPYELRSRLFERFKKESTGTESLGLGLAIVKQICDNYDLAITYENQDKVHTITVLTWTAIPLTLLVLVLKVPVGPPFSYWQLAFVRAKAGPGFSSVTVMGWPSATEVPPMPVRF